MNSPYRKLLSLVPYGAHNDDVASCDQDGWDDKQGHGDQSHVDLPLPGLIKGYPALVAVARNFGSVVKIKNWGGKNSCKKIKKIKIRYKKRETRKRDKMLLESCAPGLTSWNFLFSFSPLYKNYSLLFALPCLQVCKPEAVRQGIGIRAVWACVRVYVCVCV